MVAALTFFLSNDPSQNKEDDGNSSEEEEKKDKAKKISGMVRAAGVSLRGREFALFHIALGLGNKASVVCFSECYKKLKSVVGSFALASRILSYFFEWIFTP